MLPLPETQLHIYCIGLRETSSMRPMYLPPPFGFYVFFLFRSSRKQITMEVPDRRLSGTRSVGGSSVSFPISFGVKTVPRGNRFSSVLLYTGLSLVFEKQVWDPFWLSAAVKRLPLSGWHPFSGGKPPPHTSNATPARLVCGNLAQCFDF